MAPFANAPSTMSIITTERALQVHAVVGTLFSAPFLVKGAAEFGSMLVDGAVKPDAISKIPLFMHLFHVDFLKNVMMAATCYAASTFESRARRVVCQLNLAFIAAVSLLHPPFNLMPAVPGESLPPPPLLAYMVLCGGCYLAALFGSEAAAKKTTKKN